MSNLHVICKLGESEYAFAADEVFQLENYTGSTPVPGASSHILGLIQVRQKIIPVLNLHTRFGMPTIEPSSESRIVVVKQGDRLVGILVDSAREVQTIAPDLFREPPEVVAKQSAGYVKSVVPLKDRIIMLLDTPKVIGQEISHV